jgi:hypothetical protein
VQQRCTQLSMSGEARRDPLMGQVPQHADAEADVSPQPDSSSAASDGTPRSQAGATSEASQQEALTNLQRTLERFASGIVPSQELGGDTLASAAQQHRCAGDMCKHDWSRCRPSDPSVRW